MGSLPTTVKQIKKIKGIKPPKAKRAKQFYNHHKYHNRPHITGEPAELDTYDFDDDSEDNEGGVQKDKDKQKKGYEPVEQKEFISKFETQMYKLIQEASYTTVGRGGGIQHGDAWPDGIYTRHGERRIMGPGAMPRGMKQVVVPAADSIYGGDESLTHEDRPYSGLQSAMDRDGTLKRTKITPEYLKSDQVLDPHKYIRSDEPPLHPKMRLYGRRAFGLSSQYTIPQETANYITTGGPEGEDILKKPTTPPEGSIRQGGAPEGQIEPTPEPGSKNLGSTTGYRQVQKGGKNIIKDLDKMYVLKMLGHYDSKKNKR